MDEETLHISTQTTPNPNALKFMVGRLLIPGGSANFPSPESAAERSPLARRIFTVPGVRGVFIGSDYFTITRTEGLAWEELFGPLATALEAFFAAAEPVLTPRAEPARPMLGNSGAHPELLARIEELIATQVRPAVAQDGGDIILRGFEEGKVYLEMHGACSSCPSSTATLKLGVESMLKHHLPNDVIEVVAV